MANTKGEKELRTNYPVADGIIAETTTQQGHIMNLIPQEKTLVSQREKKGL